MGKPSSIWVVMLVLMIGASQPGLAQEPALAMRGPRFLAVPPGGGAPVDATNAAVLHSRVSLTLRKASFEAALREIARQARLELIYNPALLPAGRTVTLQAADITMAAALTEVLLHTGLDVVLLKSGQMGLMRRDRSMSGGTIVGRVVDAKSGDGVREVEVWLADTKWRTATDSVGRYRLAEVEPGVYTLTVRRLGYTKQSRKITVRPDVEDTVNVALEVAALPLNELVSTATGQQRRRDLGNAITTINADSVLRAAPIRNLTDLLSTRVPGMSVQGTTGAPGDPSKLRLRGIGSIMRSNDPVVIVDGIRINASQADRRSGNLANGLYHAPASIDQIDPNIIEKVEVFKGPSAATLYGADAANGVFVITTKRGKPGPTRWDANLQLGRTGMPGRWSEGYYRWGHGLHDNALRFCPLVDLTCQEDSLVRFQALNDPALSILGEGRRTMVSLTASGGSQALTYIVTGTLEDELGYLQLPASEIENFRSRFNRDAPDWMRKPHHYETWKVSSGVRARLGPRADMTLSLLLTRAEQQRSDLEGKVASLSRTYVDRVNNLYYQPDGNNLSFASITNYLGNYYLQTTASMITVTSGLDANWLPVSWFNANARVGLNVIPRSDRSFLPTGLVSVTDSGALKRGIGRSIEGTFGLQGKLHKPLRWGFAFETSIGANLITRSTTDLFTEATKLMPGTSTINGAGQATSRDAEASSSIYGWYIEPRITGKRLSLSAGIRLDGGSAYGTRLGGASGIGGLLGLPTFNGSWVVSEEPWFPFPSLFSSLRLRGAYGQAQVQPGLADRFRIYQYSTGSQPTVELTTLGNTQLLPERSTEVEGGFDAELLDGRLLVELTAYRKMKVDALMVTNLPASVGGGTVITNVGNILNAGMELTFGITPIQGPLMTWHAQLQYSRNRNELTKLGRGVAPDPTNGLMEGYPVGGRWEKPILGFADQNGNGVLEPQEIRIGASPVFVGRLYPAYTTALHTDLTFLGGAIGVNAAVSYDAGMTQVDQTARDSWILVRGLADPSAPLSEQAAVLAVPGKGGNGIANGTLYGTMQEVSTLRFNTLSVNYRVPASVARFLRAQQLMVALQGDNLGLHSTYRGKDPNVSARGIGEGIVDAGQLPRARTWMVSVTARY